MEKETSVMRDKFKQAMARRDGFNTFFGRLLAVGPAVARLQTEQRSQATEKRNGKKRGKGTKKDESIRNLEPSLVVSVINVFTHTRAHTHTTRPIALYRIFRCRSCQF